MKKKFDLKLNLNSDAIERLSDKMAQKVIGGLDNDAVTTKLKISVICDILSCSNTTKGS